jgi:hypothetical protein
MPDLFSYTRHDVLRMPDALLADDMQLLWALLAEEGDGSRG